MDRSYMVIDLKSFYASVECVVRGLDPITTNLVVADHERGAGTICLAITPAMKELGIKNRCRVFEIPPQVKYIMAPPRMQLYIDYSADIYGIYLRYIAKEDMHVYSIDEAFFDVTDYLEMYEMSTKELAIQIMKDIYEETGITATCGIGTNMYLAKVALDITAKHVSDHIGILDEQTYIDTLWSHRPLKDFWRIGSGITKRLSKYAIYTMYDIAHADEDFLYRLFGIDAELLIDHAWGREITTMQDIKNYKAKTNSLSSGQVLPRDYKYEECKLIVKEMADQLSLDMFEKGLMTESVTLYLGYSKMWNAGVANGSVNLGYPSNSTKLIREQTVMLYERIADSNIPIRRINVIFNHVVSEQFQQYDLFTDPVELEKERRIQMALISIKKRYGKNAVLKGMNLQEESTMAERNNQIGGHKSGSAN